MSDVAAFAALRMQRVEDDDTGAVGAAEGRRGEGVGLQRLEIFESAAVDEIVCRDDRDADVPCGLLQRGGLAVGAAESLPDVCGQALGLGLKSAAHWNPGKLLLRAATYHVPANRLVEVTGQLDGDRAIPPAWLFVRPGSADTGKEWFPAPGPRSVFHSNIVI